MIEVTENNIKDEIIKKQGLTIKSLEEKIYEIQLTGIIPTLNHETRRKKKFKRFINEHDELKKMIDKKHIRQIESLKHSMQKMERIIKANKLDKGSVSLHKTTRNYIRIAMFLNVQELLNEITNCKEENYILPNGFKVKPSSLRYQTFVNNLECVKCGLKGCFLALEKSLGDFGGNEKIKEGSGFHLNLYALNENGKEVLMTKDHIHPKSKGGLDDLSNLQTMCVKCNEKKGDKCE